MVIIERMFLLGPGPLPFLRTETDLAHGKRALFRDTFPPPHTLSHPPPKPHRPQNSDEAVEGKGTTKEQTRESAKEENATNAKGRKAQQPIRNVMKTFQRVSRTVLIPAGTKTQREFF